jgi:hypothetical protein
MRRSVLDAVLEERRSTRADPALIERWAFFVLCGYLDVGGIGPRIDTGIDVDADQLIVDILNRLSMYDDLPGPVSDAEIAEWQVALQASDDAGEAVGPGSC